MMSLIFENAFMQEDRSSECSKSYQVVSRSHRWMTLEMAGKA